MNLFFELLQVSLGTRDILSRVPSDIEWNSILREAKRHAVIGVLTTGIESLPMEQRPCKKVLLQWIGLEQIVEKSSILNLKRTKELENLFQKEGLSVCILKGISFSRYYPFPLRRQCGDIDIWTNGSRDDVMSWLKRKYEIGHRVWHNVGVDVFVDVPVEVHFHPAWVYHPIHNWHLQKWFKEKFEENRLSNDGISVMPVDFDVIFSLVHSYRHLLSEGIGLRHIVDYYYILKNNTNNTGGTKDLLRQFGLIKYAGAMMWLLSNVLGLSSEFLICEPNEKEGKFLLKEVYAAGNFGLQRRGETLNPNSLKRYSVMLQHYPEDVIWMIPWKVWHFIWRRLYL